MNKMIGPMAWVAALTSLMTACGGGTHVSRYPIGVTLNDLQPGAQIQLQNNGGDTLTLTADGPSAFATSLAAGAAYSVTVSAQPAGEICYVTSGTGTVSSANVAVTVSCNWHVAYVVEGPNTQVAGFAIDPASGAMSQMPWSPIPSQIYSFHAVIDPSGRFLIATDTYGLGVDTTAAISIFSIDPKTAALTPIAGSPFAAPAGLDPNDVVFDSSGQFVYISDLYGQLIYGFAFDSTAGTLQPLSGSPWGSANLQRYDYWPNQRTLALDASGKHLYVSEESRVYGYSLDATTGALSAIAGSPWNVAPSAALVSIAIAPNGKFFYALDAISAYVLDVDPSTGALASSGLAAYPASGADSFVIDPTGTFAYATQTLVGGSSGVLAMRIDPTAGGLSGISGSPFASTTTNILHDLAVDPSGRFVYAAAGGQMVQLGLDPSTGALTPLAASPATTPASLQHIVIHSVTH